MRIIQLSQGIIYGDAVSNDVLSIHRCLKAAGYDTAMYACVADRRLKEKVGKFDAALQTQEDDILLYHLCSGDDIAPQIPHMKGHLILRYHNITPPEFFAKYGTAYQKTCREGYEALDSLPARTEYVLADSAYNAGELRRHGYQCPIAVVPVLIRCEDYEMRPDKAVTDRYRGDGMTNILFVGRVAPNKRLEDVIAVFRLYQRDYNPQARLFLVGSSAGTEKYREDLELYCSRMGVKRVIFTGHVRFEEMLAYYQLADAFLCMSDHEGFCVPLIEAMYFSVPIVAKRTTAIPYTLGNAGILTDGNFLETAGALHRLVSDAALREELVGREKARLQEFSRENTEQQLLSEINHFRENAL